jgi:hypothetical protein
MFESNLQAINAARKQYGADYRLYVSIEKLAIREWTVQVKQPLICSGIALITEQEGAWAFPMASDFGDTKGLEEYEHGFQSAQAEADRIANAQASEQDLPNGKVWVHMSSIAKPTKQVWHIADEMKAANPQVSRKEVQDECVRRGIASGTARTQYQAWKKANDSAIANQEAAAEASKRFNSK